MTRPAAQIKLQLIAASGAVVAEKTYANISGQINWALPSGLSKGSYLLRANAEGQVFTFKVIHQ
jgi:hypothetical protein